ncbi:MAG: extracellular solute-binding protein [Deltaproteobacteria bacterium]|nr:extracellular solute-binding protein [Deltaproteobacteria bacterium]
MRNFTSLWIRTLSLVILMTTFQPMDDASSQPVNIDAAKKEGKVVVYGTLVPQSANLLHKGFEQKYGIKVEFWRGPSTQIVDRTLAESRAGRPGFDVVEAGREPMLLIKNQAVFAKYVPPSSEKFPEELKEKDALTTVWRALPISILYNTELLKPGEAPKSIDDLLDPKWKNKISISDPTRNITSVQYLWNLKKSKGEKWLDFVRALAKQQPHLVESLAPVTNAIIKGESSVGITFIKYVKQYKGPIDYVTMDKYLSTANYLGVGGNTLHPNAGRLYIEYACSAEGQKIAAQDAEFVFYPGIYPPIRNAEQVARNLVLLDNVPEDEFKKVSAELRQIFFAR